MKKKSIYLLIVLMFSMIININCVKAYSFKSYQMLDSTITIENETWTNVCKYNSGKHNINLYYKNGLTMLTDTAWGSSYKIYSNDKTIIPAADTGSFDFNVENKILVNDGKCPIAIYSYTNGLTSTTMYSSSSKKKWYDIIGIEEVYIRKDINEDMPGLTEPVKEKEPCKGIINSSLKGLINKYLGYVHIIVPILVLALGVFDFFKAMIASKEDDMKKAQKRFIIRLVAGVLVFLAPTIVNFIIDTLNVTDCLIN